MSGSVITTLESIQLSIEELLASARQCANGGAVIAPQKPFSPAQRPSEAATKHPIEAVKPSGFKFSGRSKKNLNTVFPSLRHVADVALSHSRVDFIVVEGGRTKAEQRELVNKGASQTMNSKHINGRAIDVAAYHNGGISWEAEHYLKIATAFCYAARDTGTPIRWGGAWQIPNIAECAKKPTPGAAMMDLYKGLRRSQGRKVFLDLGHFELN